MRAAVKELPFAIRLIAFIIFALNVSFIALATIMSGTLQDYAAKIYVRNSSPPEGFSKFVYSYYLHLWLAYAALTAAVYIISFRFYVTSRLDVEKRIFFIQFVFFASGLALVVFFVILFMELFSPLLG